MFKKHHGLLYLKHTNIMKHILLYSFLLLSIESVFCAEIKIEVKTAGTLLALISEKLNSITDLTISGEINSKDIVVLKKMGTSEMLTNINITDVLIKNDDGVITNAIPKEAFRGALKIKSIILPESATFIGTYFAAECNHLTSIVLPRNLAYIEETAFEGCEALSSISISESNQYFKTDQNVLFTKDGSELILYPSNKNSIEYTIPIGVKNIKMGSFQLNNHIETLNFPETLEVVEGWTCRYLPNLKKIELPKSLKEIGPYAFSKNGVTEIFLKNSIPLVLDSKAFWKSKDNCKIFVPKDSYYNYWIDDLWSAFKSIEEYNYIDEGGETNNEVIHKMVSEIKIRATLNGFYINTVNNKNIYVYAINGHIIKQLNITGEQFISLYPGNYIITNGSESKKVTVYK